MAIIFTDNHICEKCGKIFEWNYFKSERQKIDSPQFKVESYPYGKTLVHSFRQRSSGIYDIGVNCPYCDFDNHFSISIE